VILSSTLIYKFTLVGELAADDFARSALVEAINMNTNAEGLLIQGYPRTLHQAEEFTKMVSWL